MLPLVRQVQLVSDFAKARRLDLPGPPECANYFAAAGYDPT